MGGLWATVGRPLDDRWATIASRHQPTTQLIKLFIIRLVFAGVVPQHKHLPDTDFVWGLGQSRPNLTFTKSRSPNSSPRPVPDLSPAPRPSPGASARAGRRRARAGRLHVARVLLCRRRARRAGRRRQPPSNLGRCNHSLLISGDVTPFLTSGDVVAPF